MNINTPNVLIRPISFLLVGALLVSAFGFTADGWQIGNDGKNQATNAGNQLPTVEIPTVNETPEDDEDKIRIPDYVNYLTGVETTEDLHNKKPVSVLMNSNTATYGIYSAEILCEMPTEDDTTRFLAIISDTSELWKIGSIANGRGYISNISKFFGATIISGKNEDNIAYDHCDISKETLDISLHNGYFYTEYSHYHYTSAEMLNKWLNELLPDSSATPKTPYQFTDFGAETITGETKSEKISIAFSEISSTELQYNADTNSYAIYKNGCEKTDAINGKTPYFTNCFVLFADSATYDNSNGTRLVMNTIGSGDGYYFTNGTVIEIKWSSDLDGNFSFTLTDGSPLVINRGISYIAYVKTSAKDDVVF